MGLKPLFFQRFQRMALYFLSLRRRPAPADQPEKWRPPEYFRQTRRGKRQIWKI